MTTVTDELSREFKEIYDQWGHAISSRDWDWIERHFAADFLGTAQPWPTLRVNRQEMIDLDKKIETMDVRWIEVTARRYGDTVLASGVVKYANESFAAGATIAEGMPTGNQLSSLVNGRSVLYIGAWRHNGENWQIYDHHMVGIVNGFGE
jgi:hypothetical protein